MNPNEKATIHRLHGDAQSVVSKFEAILNESDDEIVLFHLRGIVERCDYISNQIETEFRSRT